MKKQPEWYVLRLLLLCTAIAMYFTFFEESDIGFYIMATIFGSSVLFILGVVILDKLTIKKGKPESDE